MAGCGGGGRVPARVRRLRKPAWKILSWSTEGAYISSLSALGSGKRGLRAGTFMVSCSRRDWLRSNHLTLRFAGGGAGGGDLGSPRSARLGGAMSALGRRGLGSILPPDGTTKPGQRSDSADTATVCSWASSGKR